MPATVVTLVAHEVGTAEFVGADGGSCCAAAGSGVGAGTGEAERV